MTLIVELGLVGGAAWGAKKLLGPALDAMGEDFADSYKSFKRKNLTNIITKTSKSIEDHRTPEEVEPISPKLLIQIVDKASMEDDDELQDIWAKLISSNTSDTESDTLFLANALGIVTKREMKLFSDFCRWSYFNFSFDHGFGDFQNTYSSEIERFLSLPLSEKEDEWQAHLNQLWQHNFHFPARVLQLQIRETHKPEQLYTSRHYNINRKAYDILEMAGLVRLYVAGGEVGGHKYQGNIMEITRMGLELRKRIGDINLGGSST